MRKCRDYIAAALLGLLPLTFGSCRQELCYDHFPTIDMSLTWEQEWERDYGAHHSETWDAAYHGKKYTDLKPAKPEWVNMIRYYDDGRYHEHYLNSIDGERFQMEDNRDFGMLLYNGDTEYIILSDVASVSDARATATTRSRTSIGNVIERHPTSRITNPPDVLYSTYIDRVPTVSNHEVKPLTAKMQPLVFTYVVHYEFDYGIERVALARGALGGMAESVYLRTGTTSDATSIILFDCGIKAKECYAEVHSFGIPGFPDEYYGRTAAPPEGRQYTLNLEVKLLSGNTVEFNFDVSDQIAKQPRGGVITVTGLHIDADQQVFGGPFDVGLTDWDDDGEVIELPVNGGTYDQ